MKVVCANTLAQARVLTGLEQLDVIGRFFPPDQYKVLEHLALGASVEQTWQEVVVPALADAASQEPVDTTDYVTAIVHTRTRIAVVADADELRDMPADGTTP